MLKRIKIGRFFILVVGICVSAGCSFIGGNGSFQEEQPLAPLPLTAFNNLDPAIQLPHPKMKPPIPVSRAHISSRVIPDADGTVELKASTLLGLSEHDVALLLGPAEERDLSPPSRILQYSFPDCELTLYLYMSVATGAYMVLHSELNNATDTQAPVQLCIAKTGSLMPANGTL